VSAAFTVSSRIYGPGGGSGLPSIFNFDLNIDVDRETGAVTSTGPLGPIAAVGAAFGPALFESLAISIPGIELSGTFSITTAMVGGVLTNVIVGENVRIFFGNRSGS